MDGKRAGRAVFEAGSQWAGRWCHRGRHGNRPRSVYRSELLGLRSEDNLYAGDTSVGCITKMLKTPNRNSPSKEMRSIVGAVF